MAKGCLKALLFAFNFLLWVGGAVLVGVGVWMMFDPTIINYLHVIDIQDNDNLLTLASYVLLGAGALSFIVGLLGCLGAIREHQGLLFLYAALLVLVLLAEVAGALLAFYYRAQIERGIVVKMQQQIKNDFSNGTATYTAWNFVQPKLTCCGANGTDDFIGSKWWNDTTARKANAVVPVSCCNGTGEGGAVMPQDEAQCQQDARRHASTSTYYYSDGCVDKLEEWVRTRTLLLALIALAIALSQILGVAFACCLRSALKTVPGKESI